MIKMMPAPRERSLLRRDFSACTPGTQGSGSRRPCSAGGFLSKQLFLQPGLYPAGPWPLRAPTARSPPPLPSFLLAHANLPSFCIPSCSGKEACDLYTGNRDGSMDWLPCSLRVLRYLNPAWTSPFLLPTLPQNLRSLSINSSQVFTVGFPTALCSGSRDLAIGG